LKKVQQLNFTAEIQRRASKTQSKPFKTNKALSSERSSLLDVPAKKDICQGCVQ
jgi:hypothetical protein